ncbi:MAG: mevalonate kinase [Anaerolineales bacterium]|nr:mevalonate kinase [Anaerolineales bacterium]
MIRRGSACGKIILLGEHAVVYGFPAVAIPVRSLQTRAELSEGTAPLRITAPLIGLDAPMTNLPSGHPLAVCIRLTAETLGMAPPGGRLTITSDIPVASGMGSGAAVSTAIVRVLASAAGRNLPAAEISRIVFAVEQIHHGTPSGVDNTVIAHEMPIYFQPGEEPETLAVGAPMHLLIADSGVHSKTRIAVGGVRERRDADPARYDGLFRQIGGLAKEGRAHLESGNIPLLGKTMDRCHELLRAIEVTIPALDRLVEAARQAGAYGAKLSGAGLGGNIIALADPPLLPAVETALRESGAADVFRTDLEP